MKFFGILVRFSPRIRTNFDLYPLLDKCLSFSGCCWSFQTPDGLILGNDSCLQLNVSSPLQAEALVVRADLLSAKALGLSSYLSQIKLLSDTLNNQIKVLFVWAKRIIRDIENLSSSFIDFSFSFISRNSNTLGDSVPMGTLCNTLSSWTSLFNIWGVQKTIHCLDTISFSSYF